MGAETSGVAQHPGESDLSHADAAGFGDLLHRVDDRLIVGAVEGLHDMVSTGAVALLAGGPRQAFAVRRIGHQPHTHVAAHSHQFRLVLPTQQVVLMARPTIFSEVPAW
jgi:hypothetical protein